MPVRHRQTLQESLKDLILTLSHFVKTCVGVVLQHPVMLVLWVVVGMAVLLWDIGCKSEFDLWCGVCDVHS